MSVGRFINMVGALIQRPRDGKYLVLKRSPEKDYAPGIWEFISGRVDQGEDYTTALRREVAEELRVAIRVDFILGTMHFYRGEPVPENEMLGLVYCCTVEQPDAIQTSWEHSATRWVSLSEAQEMFPPDYWLLEAIRRADRIRTLMPDELSELLQTTGFEL